MNIEYGKRITHQSYYEGTLHSTKEEIEVSNFSTKEQILKDVITAMAVITGGDTKKLELDIRVDDVGRYRLIKRWVI